MQQTKPTALVTQIKMKNICDYKTGCLADKIKYDAQK